MKAVDTSSDHPFEHAIVSFAVDISTSTRGQIIQAEQKLVQDLSTILSAKSHAAAKVLPWCGTAGTVTHLDQLGTLHPELGTIPSAILDSPAPRTALDNSTLWFLITDGQIQKQERERFTRLIAQHRLHGTACVTVIAGHTSWATPSQYDISVGVSVFAVVPDSLFLFYDVKASELMVLQSKGVFKSLLRGEPNPLIDETTTWRSFPRMDVHQFKTLQDGFVIKFQDLWSNHLSQELVTKILSNDDDIASLVMTLQTRDHTVRFQNWLQKQHIKVDDPLLKPRQDLFGSAAAMFKELMDILKSGGTPNHLVQSRLRRAYAINMRSFIQQFEEKQQKSMIRSSVIQSTSTRSSSRIESASSLSSAPISLFAPPPSHPGQAPVPFRVYPQPSPEPFHSLSGPQAQQSTPYNPHQPPSYTPSSHTSSSYIPSSYIPYNRTPPLYDEDPRPFPPAPAAQVDLSGLLYTPGFRNKDGSFTSKCCICASDNAPLSWLFRHQPESPNTPGFPAPGSSSPLAFPLAMGNFPETDIVSAFICCDPCSVLCLQFQTSPFLEDIVVALPMVRHAANEEPYLDVLNKVLGNRFAQQHLPQVFMAILINTAATVEESTFYSPDQFNQALEWTCSDLLYSSTEVLELSASFSRKPTQLSVMPLVNVLRESFRRMNDAESSMTRYPIEGLPVLLRVASTAMIGVEDRRRAIFRRLLCFLTESFMMIRTESSDSKADPESDWQRILWTDAPQEGLSPLTITSPSENSSKKSPRDLAPVGSIPIPKLLETPLLDPPTYNTLLQAPEFQDLTDPSNTSTSWVPPAVAAFLHALNALGGYVKPELAPTDLSADACKLFNQIIASEHLRAIALRPETIDEKEARLMIASVCAAF